MLSTHPKGQKRLTGLVVWVLKVKINWKDPALIRIGLKFHDSTLTQVLVTLSPHYQVINKLLYRKLDSVKETSRGGTYSIIFWLKPKLLFQMSCDWKQPTTEFLCTCNSPHSLALWKLPLKPVRTLNAKMHGHEYTPCTHAQTHTLREALMLCWIARGIVCVCVSGRFKQNEESPCSWTRTHTHTCTHTALWCNPAAHSSVCVCVLLPGPLLS